MSVNQITALFARDNLFLFADFGHAADQCADDVLERDDTFDAAKFIRYDAVFHLFGFQSRECVIDAQFFRDVLGRAQYLPQGEARRVQLAEQVFEVDHAHDVVERMVGYRIGVVEVTLHNAFDLLVVVRNVEPYQFAAMRHD